MTLDEAVKHALDGNAVLFLGAGFSWGAENIEGNPIPNGKALSKLLLSEVGYSGTAPLDKASAAYLRRATPEQLVEKLIPLFTVKTTTDSHRAIAKLPFRRVYTTNYDSVYEEARRQEGLAFHSVIAADDPRQNFNRENLVVHLNGSITRLTEDQLGTTFKLVSESYAADSFESSRWAFHFRNDLRIARAVIFVGYSMYDLDIRRAVFGEDISEKCYFITAPITTENALDAEDLSDLGVVAPVGLDQFACEVREIESTYSPEEPEILLNEWMEVPALSSSTVMTTDQEVINFLEIGDFSDALKNELIGPHKNEFSIDRPVIGHISEELITGSTQVVIVGELGSGKSVICDVVAQELIRQGYDVYSLVGSSPDEIGEAELICGLNGKKLLIVENYQRHLDFLTWFSQSKPQDTVLLITARPSAHDLLQSELYEMFGPTLRLHEISTLSHEETLGAVALFDRYGLWGDLAAWGRDRKAERIRRDNSSALSSLLLDMLKSRHIGRRFTDVLQSSGNRKDVEAVLICAFSLEVVSIYPRVSHIEELLAHSVDWAGLRNQAALRSIISFSSHAIHARSSVLSRYLLHEVFTAKRICEVLVRMVKEADERRVSKEYYQILNTLMRYGSVSSILPEASRLESTINFYEGVKNLSSTKRNPQFWLQYAIAAMAIGRLERAERYFKDAYALAWDGYDTFQIDNHYARFLIEKGIVNADISDAILQVNKATKIVLQQMASEVRYYPYRVATGIFRFYDKVKRQLSPADKASFKRTFLEIEKRTESAGGGLKKNRYVIECSLKAKEALAELA